MFPTAVIDCIRQAREPRIDEINAVAEHMLRDISGQAQKSYFDRRDPQWHHAVRAARQALTGSASRGPAPSRQSGLFPFRRGNNRQLASDGYPANVDAAYFTDFIIQDGDDGL